jgi:Spy/CpxP family protein refolding chaperone
MNKSKWMTGIAVLTLGASLAIAAPIDTNNGNGGKNWDGQHEGRHGRHHRDAGFNKLNLSDTQKAQIADIRKASRAENQSFYSNFRATMQELHAAKKANDTAKVESLKPTVQSQREQMKQIRSAEQQRVMSVLTDEQRTQLEQFRTERAARRAAHQSNNSK